VTCSNIVCVGAGVSPGGGGGGGGAAPHRAAGADPLPVGDLGQRGVQAVDVVRGGARVAAQQLAAVLAHAAELHVVVVLLLLLLLRLAQLLLPLRRRGLPRLPLDALLLLQEEEGEVRGAGHHNWGG